MSLSFSTSIMKKRPPASHAASEILKDAIRRLPATTVSSLTNGFRIACEENPHALFATVGIWMDIGSKYEIRGENRGAAKMLEVCGLQATETKNRSEIAKALDSIGGHLNYETGIEHSYLYLKCQKEHVSKAVEILSEIALKARLAEEDIERAREIIIDQQRMHEEQLDKVTDENLYVCAYDSPNQGIGNTTLASEKCIKSLDKNLLTSFRKTHYTAPRMVLVGVGAVNHVSLEKLAKNHFSDLPNVAKPKIESRYVGGDIRLWNCRQNLVFLNWAVETCGAASGDNIPLKLASHLFGNYHRSQHDLSQHHLFRTMKMYSALDQGGPPCTHFPHKGIELGTCFHQSFEDTGLLGMKFVMRQQQTENGQSADNVFQILQYTMLNWTRLSNRSMHDPELEQAKVNYKSQLLFNMDGSTNTAEDIGKQVLHIGRRVPIAEMYERIDDTTTTNMMEVLQHYYYSRRPVYSMTGTLGSIPNYDWLAILTYKLTSLN